MGVSFVTGASSGIGRSLARRLAAHDAVAAVARRKGLLDSLVTEIEAAGGRAIAVAGTVHCIESALPGMLDRGAGHLVAMSSLAGYRGLPSAAAYSGAKAGLTNLMESLRVDLRPRGIDVTVLLPGFVQVKPGAKKSKPFQLELEVATARMERAILARQPRYAFPWPMVLALSVARSLPASLVDRMLAGRGRPPKAKP